MDKHEFTRRLERAGERARQLADSLVLEPLPETLLFNLPHFDDPKGSRGPEGTIKYFGGRFIKSSELNLVSASKAAKFLWIDGMVPSWVNMYAADLDSSATHILMLCSKNLVHADEESLPRDIPIAVVEGDPVEPFRVRGPQVPGEWRSLEEDGQFAFQRFTIPPDRCKW